MLPAHITIAIALIWEFGLEFSLGYSWTFRSAIEWYRWIVPSMQEVLSGWVIFELLVFVCALSSSSLL